MGGLFGPPPDGVSRPSNPLPPVRLQDTVLGMLDEPPPRPREAPDAPEPPRSEWRSGRMAAVLAAPPEEDAAPRAPRFLPLADPLPPVRRQDTVLGTLGEPPPLSLPNLPGTIGRTGVPQPVDDQETTGGRQAMPPQGRAVRAAGVTFIRDGDPSITKELQTGHDAAQNEASYPRLTAQQALRHYLEGSGTPLRMDFAQLNTQAVLPTDFRQVREALAAARNGTSPRELSIDDKLEHSEVGENAYLLGNVTLKLQGTLIITQEGYQFRGALKAYDDRYDFNPSDHRSRFGEALTRYVTGETICHRNPRKQAALRSGYHRALN
jgi:hypothetical protein